MSKSLVNVSVEQIGELLRQVASGRITRIALQEFLERPREKSSTPPAVEVTLEFELEADYVLTVDQMIKAAGLTKTSFDPDRDRLFHDPRAGRVSIQAGYFDCEPGPAEELVSQMKSQGFRPCNAQELMAFAAKFPHEQENWRVMAIGTLYTPRGGHQEAYSLSTHPMAKTCRWVGWHKVDYKPSDERVRYLVTDAQEQDISWVVEDNVLQGGSISKVFQLDLNGMTVQAQLLTYGGYLPEGDYMRVSATAFVPGHMASEILRDFPKRRLRSATLEELRAFVMAFPGECERRDIYALGVKKEVSGEWPRVAKSESGGVCWQVVGSDGEVLSRYCYHLVVRI